MSYYSRWALAAVAIIGLAFMFTGCRPKYPLCENDDHCAEYKEVCVDKKCQQCRDDSNCPEGQICEENRCVPKPECRADSDCQEPLVCRDQKCVPECAENSDCGTGMKCEGQKCVDDVMCKVDTDCNEGMECLENNCVEKKAETPPPVEEEVVQCDLSRIHFDFDDYNIRNDAKSGLDTNVSCLKTKSNFRLKLEGHCDERGTTEYNLSLGEKRANSAKRYLTNMGIAPKAIDTVSYGEEKPLDSESSEEAWSKNRRVEFEISE